MKDEQFDELIESIQQGGAILRGKMQPTRVFMMDKLDVKRIGKFINTDGFKPEQFPFLLIV